MRFDLSKKAMERAKKVYKDRGQEDYKIQDFADYFPAVPGFAPEEVGLYGPIDINLTAEYNFDDIVAICPRWVRKIAQATRSFKTRLRRNP